MAKTIHFIRVASSLHALDEALAETPASAEVVCLSPSGEEPARDEIVSLAKDVRGRELSLIDLDGHLIFSRALLDKILPLPRQTFGATFHPADWIVPIAEREGRVRRIRSDSARRRVDLRGFDKQKLRAFVKNAVAEWEKDSALNGQFATRMPRGALRRRAVNLLGFAAHSLRSRTYQTPRSSTEFIDERSSREIRFETASRTRAFNILLPHLKFNQVFGGMATALKLAIELAKRGESVRLICTDSALTETQREGFEDYFSRVAGSDRDARARLSLVDGSVEGNVGAIDAGRDDIFIATAWWTASLADKAIRAGRFSSTKFFYLIQDFEPGFYPWSQDYALAEASYRLTNYTPIFNTGFLEDYFRQSSYFTGSRAFTISPEINFQKFFPSNSKRAAGPTRILFYGRPSVPRNLFPVIISGLDEWIRARGITSPQVEIVSAGERHGEINFPNGIVARSVGVVDSAAYPDFLRGFDIGISLMLSPHPSYPPLEMAASGILTITNSYATKDLSKVSPNFLVIDPHPARLADALDLAMGRVNDFANRKNGSHLELPPALALSELAAELGAQS